MSTVIKLKEVIFDARARDGTWCRLPYPRHPNGCPNFPQCIEDRLHFDDVIPRFSWVAVIVEFDLEDHARRMKEKHPHWSERQCRNLLYWQGSVNKALRIHTKQLAAPLFGDVILDRPEANGVNLFATMAKHGVMLKSNPDLVRKIMFVGVNLVTRK